MNMFGWSLTMSKKLMQFINNRDGAISIQFAGGFILFIMLLLVIYDIYSSVMQQNKLERATYSVASIFRERSALYPSITTDDTDLIHTGEPNNSSGSTVLFCDPSEYNSACSSYEFINLTQVEQARELAATLLNKSNQDIAIRIDNLMVASFPLQTEAELSANNVVVYGSSYSSCPDNNCPDYLRDLPSMLPSDGNDYTSSSPYLKLTPYVSRIIHSSDTHSSTVKGRWIPLFRVSLCAVNDESLFLNFFDRTRNDDDGILPNLCHSVVVLSRCNDLASSMTGCPVYFVTRIYN